MKKIKVFVAILTVIFASLILLSACKETGNSNTEATPSGEITSTPTEEQYTFPENGELKLLDNGLAPSAPNGSNPSLSGNKLIIFFDFATKKVGLDLKEDTEITYKIKSGIKVVSEGTASLDTSVADIKNEYGYIGVCFDMGITLKKLEQVIFEISFKDATGKEFHTKNIVCNGISYYGINKEDFDEHLDETVTTTIGNSTITQKGTINGTAFTFTIGLTKWANKTTTEQIVTVSRLFWQVYPRMYERFGAAGNSPTSVSLDIEDDGYEIASASGNKVHIHDQWLQDHPKDFDCLTHEFAHVIQNGWDGNYCEYSGYIERFADCCRYLYAFNDGEYNDTTWELQTIEGENTRETSVRFLVWLDYTYSTEGNDLLLKFFTACRSKKYPADNWDDAWAEILKGSSLEGKDIDEVWKTYASSEFATLSSRSQFGSSPLSRKYDVRAKLDD